MNNERTDFLPHPNEPEREPKNIDFSNPEIANWGEIKEAIWEDEELKQDLENTLNKAAQKNKDNPKIIKTIGRIAAILGLTVAVLAGARFVATKNGLEETPDIPETSDTQGATEKRHQATSGITDQEAREYLENTPDVEAQKEKEMVEEALTPSEVPNTVKDQNFEGLDTSSLN